ncbi:hypothetical protein ACRRTK_001071 [Alexandromys fortis]
MSVWSGAINSDYVSQKTSEKTLTPDPVANERPPVPAPGCVRRVRPRARGVGGGRPGGGRDAGLGGGGGGRGHRRPRWWRRRRPLETAGPVMRLRSPRPGASAQP